MVIRLVPMSNDFEIVEATIDEIHDAMKAGELSSEALTNRYLDRIKAYDQDGPELNSIITINEEAVDRAAELDKELNENGFVGPLHGIPVLVKDQAETADIRTTFGSETCLDYVPDEDATLVSNVKEAGGIVLAKTNLPDFASAFFGHSSAAGQTKNPYDTSRDPGGSSSGTGSAVAANLGTVGIGEDTGGSVRVPSANCNLYGIRVTTGLISCDGHSPIVPRQDTPGPMARTMTDMTKLLDVLVGYDPKDEWTGAIAQIDVESYTDYLNEDGLEGTRIGVLREAFGDDDNPRAASVNDIVESALEKMVDAGAELVDPVSIPDMEEQIGDTVVYEYYAKLALNDFLAERELPYDSVREIYEAGEYHEDLDLIESIAHMDVVPEEELDFWRKTVGQESFRRDILETFTANELNGIVFPDVQVVPPKISELGDRYTTANYPTNTPIGAQSQCPAISVPGGLTENGLPVGVEILGIPYNEHRLIEMAYAYEQAVDTREPPETTPPL
ncbi:amidase [Natronorubrum sp. A-ect3]|uniref:amidase n=1 Tax=Natronorubrum sp. A-ect3 TaxID=3242698 RepID=UPI00359E33F6